MGAIHTKHFEARNHYSLQDLQAQVLSLEPDLICAEITPEAFDGPTEGYFPPEAAFLAAMAPGWKVRFAPVDWRMDLARQNRAEAEEPPAIKAAAARMEDEWISAFRDFQGASMYDFLHSARCLELNDRKFEKLFGENTVSDVAAGCWHERNRRIVENGLAAAGAARRIVFVFGDAHLPQLIRQLKARGIEAKIPPRHFEPADPGAVSPAVLDRWRRNLRNLKAIRDGKLAVSEDAAAKVRSSHRIQDLEKAIQSFPPNP